MSDLDRIQTKDYQQTFSMVRNYLLEMSTTHGALKHWCADNQLNYNTVVRIKNGNLGYLAPHLLKRLLEALGYTVKLTRSYLDEMSPEDDILYVVKKR